MGHFWLFWAIFWVGVDLKNCFGLCSCSWITFIFFVSFNSDLWIWVTFGVLYYFLGPLWAIIGVGVGFDNCFGGYLFSWTTFLFFVSFNSDMRFWLNSGVFFTFWGLNGLFLGPGKGSKTVLGSTHVVEQLSFSMLPLILTFDLT